MSVYTVNVAFEANDLAYEAGQQYELSDEVVATLAEGTVTPLEAPVVPEVPVTSDDAPLMGAETQSTGEAAAASAEPATPWVGNHTVGRD